MAQTVVMLLQEDERVCQSLSRCLTPCDPHGLQPARLLCPWDFPSKNTGVGCHLLLKGIFPTQGSNSGLLHYRQILYHLSYQCGQKVKVKESEVVQSCPTVCDPMDTRLLHPWDFSRQEYWRGLPFPSQGNFPTQGSNPGLPHCRQTLYRLSHQGNTSVDRYPQTHCCVYTQCVQFLY